MSFGRSGLVALALLSGGCAVRPDGLAAEERLNAECSVGTRAYTYTVNPKSDAIIGPAVAVGCFAPIGAWTSESDAQGSATRKIAYELRQAKKTFLCCF